MSAFLLRNRHTKQQKLPCSADLFQPMRFSDDTITTCAKVSYQDCFGTTEPCLPCVSRCGADLILYIQEDMYPYTHSDWLDMLRALPVFYLGIYLVLVGGENNNVG